MLKELAFWKILPIFAVEINVKRGFKDTEFRPQGGCRNSLFLLSTII